MSSKKNTVLFLGAGASKAFGYPLTKEILPKIIGSLNNETLFKEVKGNLGIEYRFLLKELLIALSPGLKLVLRKANRTYFLY